MQNEDPMLKKQISETYIEQKPLLIGRLRKAGKTIEEAEDMVQDLYAETIEKLPFIAKIRNLQAWINSLFRRRIIDVWRHEQVKAKVGHVDLAEETIQEVIAGAGFNPLDEFVRENLVDAMQDAIRILPKPQRAVIEAQVFKNKTFKEIAEETGESIDTLTARKRYAIKALSHALKDWITED